MEENTISIEEFKQLQETVAELNKQLEFEKLAREKAEKDYSNQKIRAEKAEKKKPEAPDFESIINQKIKVMSRKEGFIRQGVPAELVEKFITSEDSEIPEELLTPYVQPDVPEPKEKENENQPQSGFTGLELDLYKGE